MFMREVRAAGRLTHPSIVTIFDAFDDDVNQTSCIVMELVPGVTLEKILESGKPPTIEQTLELIRQVGEALDYAHRNKVIHRDLKPANILVTDDGRAKITDFGIAKVLAREGVARTIGIMGTPSYMSPEQVRGGEIDARTDIFSLGIMIFTMLTGQKPFSGNTAAVMFKIVYEEPPLPSSVNPHLSPGHDYLVKKCLAKDRADRFSSVREMLTDLDDIQRGHPPRSEATIPVPAPTLSSQVAAPADRTVVTPSPVPTTRRNRSRRASSARNPIARREAQRRASRCRRLRYETAPAAAVIDPGFRAAIASACGSAPFTTRRPPASKTGSALDGKNTRDARAGPCQCVVAIIASRCKVPPAPPDSTLMGRTLPMRVPICPRFHRTDPPPSGNAIADSAQCSFAGKHLPYAGAGPCRGYAP